MFVISFLKSSSKFYNEVKKLASFFNDHIFDGERHTVTISLKECFEKWDFFNLLFWRTVDWRQSYLEFDGYKLYSHSDKTRIFYAVQSAKNNWLCITEIYARDLDRVVLGIDSADEVRSRAFSPDNADQMLDWLVVEKERLRFLQEFGDIKFEAPLSLIDYEGRRKRREERKKDERSF